MPGGRGDASYPRILPDARSPPRPVADESDERSMRLRTLVALLVMPARALASRRPARFLQQRTLVAAALTAAALPAQTESFQGNGLFSLPRSQDDVFEWRTAREELTAGKLQEAVERLHLLLDDKKGGVVPVLEGVDRYLGLRAAVIETLRDLPPDAVAAYERLVAREGGGLLRDAFTGSRPDDLLAVARAFPAAEPGRLARIRLGDLEFVAGRPTTALRHYVAARDATGPAHRIYPGIERRLVVARALAEGERTGDPLPPELEVLVAQARTSLPGAEDALRDHFGFARRPPSPPRGRARLMRSEQVAPTGFGANEFAMHVVGDASGLFITDGLSVIAIDPFDRRRLWEGEGPFLREGEDYREYEGQIDVNFALAPAVNSDIVVAALQVPTEGENSRFRQFDVIVKIPSRRLVAFDRRTGKQRWTHYDGRNGAITRRFAGHEACAPPVIVGDTVFVPSHDKTGSIAFSVAAYDVNSGEPRWRRLICSSQLEVNMFGNARREFAASPLALHGGVIYGCTNLGVCFALDQADGVLRWVSAYEVTNMPQTRLTHQEDRAVYFANNPVCVAAGVLACTPLDSEYVVGMDCSNGRMLWRLPYLARMSGDNNVRWLLGAIGDEFIVSGQGVLAIKARPTSPRQSGEVRLVRSRENLGVDPLLDLPPRGAIVGNRIYYPSSGGVSVFDAHGTADPIVTSLPRLPRPGNLLLTDGLLVSARSGAIDVCYDVDSLLQFAERQVRDDPDDPVAALSLAQMLRAQAGDNLEGGLADRAAEILRGGIAACQRRGVAADDPTRLRLGGLLFDLTVARAMSVGKREPDRALAMLRRARDEATDDDRWLVAHRRVLTLTRAPADTCRELDLLAERLGEAVVHFDGGVLLPASAFALWQCAEREVDPGRMLARWQGLLERYPDIRIDGIDARTLATQRIARLLDQHGQGIYEPIERRARDAMAAAIGDATSLSAVVERFPHSAVARDALRSIMDLAVADGDLDAAVRCARRATERGTVTPGLLRRLQATATRRGNEALAAALDARLRTEHGGEASDFPTDAGRSYKELTPVVGAVAAAPLPPAPALTHRVAHIAPTVPGTGLSVFEVEVVQGFAAAPDVPMFLLEGGAVLRAHDLRRSADRLAIPIYSLDCPRLMPTSPVFVCGDRLVVGENDRIRGIELDSGRVRWTHAAEDDRALYALGVHRGVLVLFSEHHRAADGGTLLGIEPMTGAVMFERRFGALEPSIAPVGADGAIWSLRPGDEGRLTLHHIDPISGQTVGRIALRDDTIATLGLTTEFARQASLLRMHDRLLVDAETIYLAADGVSEDRNRPPTIVALTRDGSTRWTWRGSPGRALQHLALRSDTLGVVENGPVQGGRLVALNTRSGREVYRVEGLGRSVQVLSPRRVGSPERPGSDVIAIAGLQPDGWRLLCRSLTQQKPAIRVLLPGDINLAVPQDQPAFGSDFVVAAMSLLVGQNETLLLTYDLENGTERARVRLPGTQAQGLRRVGPWVALETSQGVTILGDRGAALR